MKIEKQVVSLELAKKLKDLGVNTVSLFSWRLDLISPKVDLSDNTIDTYSKHLFPAYTVAELGEMLWKSRNMLMPVTIQSMWCGVDVKNQKELVLGEITMTEADARAKMLIYLIENKLVNNPTQSLPA